MNIYRDAIDGHLCAAFEIKFPGFTATSYGMKIDPEIAVETTKGWKP